eukprot:366144-Chlamydomonas_euryale.AAC.5
MVVGHGTAAAQKLPAGAPSPPPAAQACGGLTLRLHGSCRQVRLRRRQQLRRAAARRSGCMEAAGRRAGAGGGAGALGLLSRRVVARCDDTASQRRASRQQQRGAAADGLDHVLALHVCLHADEAMRVRTCW